MAWALRLHAVFFFAAYVVAAAGLAVGEFTISTEAKIVLQANNLTIEDVHALGLTSTDLEDIGLHVQDRIRILRLARSKFKQPTTMTAIDTADDGIVVAQDFAFAATYINSTRQYGTCIHMIVKYRYPSEIQNQSYLDYRDIYSRALWYAQPSEALPMETQWELINYSFVQEIMATYDLAGISSQIQVMNSQDNPYIVEPGNHGSTVTVGDFGQPPTAEPWVNTFQYDCTKE